MPTSCPKQFSCNVWHQRRMSLWFIVELVLETVVIHDHKWQGWSQVLQSLASGSSLIIMFGYWLDIDMLIMRYNPSIKSLTACVTTRIRERFTAAASIMNLLMRPACVWQKFTFLNKTDSSRFFFMDYLSLIAIPSRIKYIHSYNPVSALATAVLICLPDPFECCPPDKNCTYKSNISLSP